MIDYDVYSYQGKELYIAITGQGIDPLNGRRFNIQKKPMIMSKLMYING
ncbi:hypothetical protein ACO0LH_13175 [Undibacterium sp. TJN19]